MAEPETDEENVSFYSHPQFWQALFVMAIVLNVFAIVASDLGLDAHVEGAYIETENGWALDWGDTRTEDPDASNPDIAKEVPENSVNSEMIMSFAVLGMIVAILVATRIGFNRTTITILMLNPALIFSIGRGYSEYTYIAILGIAWIVWSHSKKYTDRYIPKVTAITMAAVLVLWIAILKLKVEPMEMLLPLLGLIVIGVLIDRMPDDWFNPQKAMIGGFGIGLLSIVALGMMGYGSFTIVNTESIRFIQAVPVAIFGAAIVYGLVGMVLWPFAKQTWTLMGESNDRLTGELSLFIGTLTGVIVAYVACLWTYESTLWSSEWPWHMWTMGNNGRYITILAIPCFVLIKRVNGEIDWGKPMAVAGILILLPISQWLQEFTVKHTGPMMLLRCWMRIWAITKISYSFTMQRWVCITFTLSTPTSMMYLKEILRDTGGLQNLVGKLNYFQIKRLSTVEIYLQFNGLYWLQGLNGQKPLKVGPTQLGMSIS